MPKISKYARMAPEDIESVVAELRRWGQGEFGSQLTWAVLEKRFGYTRSAMDRKSEIKAAYQQAKRDLNQLPGTREEVGQELQSLQNEVERLRKQVAEYERRERLWRERWQRIAFNIRLKGMHVHLIDRPASGPMPDEQETAQILEIFDKEILPARKS